MVFSQSKKKELENHAKNYNDGAISEGDSRWDKAKKYGKRTLGFIPIVWAGGTLRHKYMRKVAPWIGLTPRSLTLTNALTFGLGLSSLYMWGGDEIGEFMDNFDMFEEAGNYAASTIASIIGITTATFLKVYGAWDLGQTLYRIQYSARKKEQQRGHASLCGLGLITNGGYALSVYSRKKRMDRHKRKKLEDSLKD